MGVRSMCCFLEGEPSLLIDPGVSLAPNRFGLPPHQAELKKLAEKRQLIQEYAQRADIITISHWHHDHYTPFMTGLFSSVTPELARSVYEGKKVFAKGVKGLNFMQKQRAHSFLGHCTADLCDGKVFTIGNTTLTFSPPVPHGASRNVPVIMLSVENEKKVVHASDTQGISGIDFIKNENPDLLIMSSPPSYLLSLEETKKAQSNILEVADHCDELILDHHLLRDLAFRDELREVWKNPKVKTAAEYAGQSNLLLEARRKELYSGLAENL